MSTTMTEAPVAEKTRGRSYFWAGIILALLALGLVFVQYGVFKQLMLPWYAPILTTCGALLLLLSLASRRTFTRIIAFLLVGGLSGLLWFFLGVYSKLPAYQGPAEVGKPVPAFQTQLADGRTFTDQDLRGKERSVIVFYRGRW